MKPGQKIHPNHLIHEKSPYLLQHAYNPVNWYPWGEEALSLARKENKPIFLSIGYSTCHWCHVMEEESFENQEIAAFLNRNFICIKVDREERPDLDKIYMEAVLAMTGSGGWPLNVFLTPDLKPFFGGTYFPPKDRIGYPGLLTLIPKIASLWKEHPEQIQKSGEELVRRIREERRHPSSDRVGPELLDSAFNRISGEFDPEHGGFGWAPKFPQTMTLSFLLRYYDRTGNGKALSMVEQTLREMGRGGIYDQIGGGFHRYSTDERWRIPHFEKMLYDNALLARIYLEAFQITGTPHYEKTAREILDYVLRDLSAPSGGFYSAEDADSNGEEGLFYTWTRKEIDTLLGRREGRIFSQFYGITEEGNFEKGRNILYRPFHPESFVRDRGISLSELSRILSTGRSLLLSERSKRVRPHRDDKILTAWNGLMISSLAYAAQVLDDKRYADSAEKSARFLLDHLMDGEKLLRRFREGEARFPAYLDDYAFLIQGLIDLYQATFDPEWIRKALALNRIMIGDFYDSSGKGFFYTGGEDPTLITRTKEFRDDAKPSGNGVAVMDLLRLAEFTGDPSFKKKAVATLQSIGALPENPMAFAQSLMDLDFLLGQPMEIAVAESGNQVETAALLRAVRQPFSPNKVIALKTLDSEEEDTGIRYLEGKVPISGRATVYICRNFTCKRPVTDPEEVKRILTRRTGK